jgi:hypothetical protein
MINLFSKLASKNFNCNKLILFRSESIYIKTLLNSNTKRMSSTINIEDLKAKSNQANDMIEKLKNQIEQIKLATSPAQMAERAKNLQKENEQLKKRVDELKTQLEEAEAKNPSAKAGIN